MKLKILDKIARTVKRAVAKEQGVIDRSMQKEIRTYVNKSKKLLKTAEIIEIAHAEDAKSIGELKEQISNLKNAERELQHSRKELSQVPASLEKLEQEQSDLRREVNVLNHENRKLFLQAMRGEITYDKMKGQREDNYKEIKAKNSKIHNNNIEIKNFEEKIKRLHNNIQNNSINFKKEVATLEFKIRSIEKGPAPKPPIQSLKGQDPKTPIQPVRPVPLSPKEIRDNLQKLAGSFNNHGADDTGKQSLREKLALLNKFGIIDDENLQNMQNSINKPTITGQELSNIISTVTKSIDHDVDSRMEKFINRPQTFEGRFADKFAGRVEGNNQEPKTFAGRVEERTQEGNNQETQTFADKVKGRGRTQEENKTYRL